MGILKRRQALNSRIRKVENINKTIKKLGMHSDTIDVHAEYDTGISYAENKKAIIKKFKQEDKREQAFSSNIDLKYAQQFHEMRSPRARAKDESSDNKHSYTERQIASKPERLDSWFKRPGGSDIIGIDGGFGRRKKNGR